MAIPNIVNVATIHAETILGDLTTTLTTQGGDKDNLSVAIQPKLRSDFAGNFVRFSSPKGLFRLVGNEVSWSADKLSNYGISFVVQEVI